MTYSIRFIALLLCCIIASNTPTHLQAKEEGIAVTVLAGSSLTHVMTELVRLYSRKSTSSISTSFDSPDTLAELIEEGESADIFISEDYSLITRLKQQGLIDVFSITPLAKNHLVFVVPRNSYLEQNIPSGTLLDKLFERINEQSLLVITDPNTVPAGKTVKEALTTLGYWDTVSPNTIRSANSSQAMRQIVNGRMVGITYVTDAIDHPSVKIISEFPENTHEPIIYHAAVVAGENMPNARKFLHFLKSREALDLLAKYGFSML